MRYSVTGLGTGQQCCFGPGDQVSLRSHTPTNGAQASQTWGRAWAKPRGGNNIAGHNETKASQSVVSGGVSGRGGGWTLPAGLAGHGEEFGSRWKV